MKDNESPVQLRWPAKLNEVPKEIFHREDIYRLELDRIFYGREWHMLAHRAEIPDKGDFKTAYIGEAPVIVIHGDDGRLRVFSNSCPHRGTQLATCARGSARTIECPYHRWTFNTRGDLLGAPGMGDFPKEFRKQDYGLRVIRSAEFHGLVFASFNSDVVELDEYLDDTKQYIVKLLGGDGRLKLIGYQKVSFATNWKEYSDNEGYHVTLLHKAFRHLKFSQGTGVQFMTKNAHKVNCVELENVKNVGFLEDHSVVEGRDPNMAPHNIIVVLYPMTVITRNLDVISLRYAFPRSPHETEVHYAYFAREDDDDEMLQHRIRQASNLIGPSGLISLEDGAVFNRLHAGSQSGGTVSFQKGVKGEAELPYLLDKGDEAGNLVRWEHYRDAMGFERASP